MTLVDAIAALATRIGTEIKGLRSYVNGVSVLPVANVAALDAEFGQVSRWLSVTSSGLGTDIGQATWSSHSGTFLVRNDMVLDTAGQLRQRQTIFAESQYLSVPGQATRTRRQIAGVWQAWSAWEIIDQVSFAYVDQYVGRYSSVSTWSSATFTPTKFETGYLLRLTNAGAVTITLPTFASADILTTSQFDFVQMGGGPVTFVAGSGATVNGTPSLVMRAQYSVATAVKVDTNEWLVVGDLA